MPHNKLKNIRLEANLTQQQMADLLFVSQSCYCKLENGTNELNISIIIRIVSVFKEKAAHVLHSKECPIVLSLENLSVE